MSYYDFDNHFWSSSQVCGQSEELEEDNEPSFASRMLGTIFAAFKPEERNNHSRGMVESQTSQEYLAGEPKKQI